MKAGPRSKIYSSLRDNNENAVTVTVARGEDVTGVNLEFPGVTGLSISGRVINEQGQPVTQARVYAFNSSTQEAYTGADGTFTVGGLLEGRQTIQVRHDAYNFKGVLAEAGATNVEIILQAAAAVSGIVLDKSTGRPVSDFEIMVRSGNGPIHPADYWQFSRRRNDDGAFTLSSVQIGSNVLAVRADGYAKTEMPLTNSGEK